MRIIFRKNKILIIIIGIAIVLSLNFFQKQVKGFFYFISSPIQKTLWQAGDGITGFFNGIVDLKNVKLENEELKLRIQELLADNVSLQELEKENQVLREGLELGLQKDFRLSLAEVISKDVGQDSILIDQGSKDGIAEGMPVITQQKVLLGKITEVYSGFSRVALIFNKESSFDAKVSGRDVNGVVKGDGNMKIRFDLVPQDKELKEGDLIVSRAMGGIYPEGILVGPIKKADKSDVGSFYKAEVLLLFDVKDLENVLIILNYD